MAVTLSQGWVAMEFRAGKDGPVAAVEAGALRRQLEDLIAAESSVIPEEPSEDRAAIRSMIPGIEVLTAAVPIAGLAAASAATLTAVAKVVVAWISAGTKREVQVQWPDGRSVSIKGGDATVDKAEDLIRQVAAEDAASGRIDDGIPAP